MSTANLQEDGRIKRPPDTSLHQQRLSAWKPLLYAQVSAPLFLIWGVVCLPLGILIVMLSSSVQEFSYDYTYCVPYFANATTGWTNVFSINGTNSTGTYSTCADWVADWRVTQSYDTTCVCVINFTLPQAIAGPVNVYYGLTSFYQNHHRIWRSRDDAQLSGQSKISSYQFCSLDYNPPPGSPSYAPCGALANAIWNDSFTSFVMFTGSSTSNVTLSTNNIVLPYDSMKYINPPGNNATDRWSGMTKLPNWKFPVSSYGVTNISTSNGTVSDLSKMGYQYPLFINWMHSSALSNFQKLFAQIDSSTYPNGLAAGNYQIKIVYSYPVTIFGGTKQFILSTSSWLGGNMPLLGYLLLSVGCIYLFVAILFLITHFRMANNLITKYGLNNDDLDPETDLD